VTEQCRQQVQTLPLRPGPQHRSLTLLKLLHFALQGLQGGLFRGQRQPQLRGPPLVICALLAGLLPQLCHAWFVVYKVRCRRRRE
jgi:hypothetical protein